MPFFFCLHFPAVGTLITIVIPLLKFYSERERERDRYREKVKKTRTYVTRKPEKYMSHTHTRTFQATTHSLGFSLFF